jgi:starch synthase
VSLGPLRHVRRRRSRPRILLCTPEVTELPEGRGNATQYIRAKGGGLGDISAGLIRHLRQYDRFDIHIALPKYDAKIRDLAALTVRELDMLSRVLDRQGIHLVSDSAFSSLTDVYGESAAHPRVRRSQALQRHIINHLLPVLEPDVVHCNDWMTGLVPAAARAKGIHSVFTLHNVFTEYATPRDIDLTGIDVRQFLDFVYFRKFPESDLDNWSTNAVDFTSTGIYAADVVNTVSPTFLDEIVGGAFPDIIPDGIRHAVREKYAAGKAVGILNAPGELVDPRINPDIVNYDVDDVVEKKRENKLAFQDEMGLRADPDAPLFFWPSRLYAQKGPELLLAVADRCIKHHGLQIALVASGDREVADRFYRIGATSHGRLAHREFRDDLSVRGMAAADFVLMPSRYEPCGLPQMEAPRYGTLPIARRTGGLRDTVTELSEDGTAGNGFVFEPYAPEALATTIARAVAFHRKDPAFRRRVVQRIMREGFERFTLANTARQYVGIYDALLHEE